MAAPGMPPAPTAGLTGRVPMGSAPLSPPGGNPGQSADALAKVREAIKILETALPSLPTGSDPYKSVLNAITQISKHVSPSSEVPGVQQTALRDLQQQAQQSGVMQSLLRSLGGGSGNTGAGAPATPSPGGAGAPAMAA